MNGPGRGDDFDYIYESEEEVDDYPFYRRPLFYVPLVSLLVIIGLAIVIFKPFNVMPIIPTEDNNETQSFIQTPSTLTPAPTNATPYYDPKVKLLLPEEAKNWQELDGEVWCEIGNANEWFLCYPVKIDLNR